MYADLRGSALGTGDDYTTWSGGLEVQVSAPVRSVLRERSSRIVSQAASGWLHVAGVHLYPVPWTGLELQGGLRSDTDELSGQTAETRWAGVSADLQLQRGW